MERYSMGAFLAALRKASGMTQRQLADRLNVSDKAVSRWERDENAPDLSLIPVIAEIFSITSDELLRGRRSTPGENPQRAAAERDKQTLRLLNKTLTTYHIQSAISITISLIGLIAAMIGNLGFLRARIGFLCGCVFFLISGLCQIIWGILARHRMSLEEIEKEITAPFQKKILYAAQITYIFIFTVFSATLPLIVLTWDTYMGLNAKSWLWTGALFALGAAITVASICIIINARTGYWAVQIFRTPIGKLRLRCVGIAIIIACSLLICHVGLYQYLKHNYHLLTSCETFTTWTDFRHYMETPLDPNGEPLEFLRTKMDASGSYIIYGNNEAEYTLEYNNLFKKIYTNNDETTPIIKYRNLNMYVSHIKFSDTSDMLPVQVYTAGHLYEAKQKTNLYCGLYAVLYLAVPTVSLCIYYPRKKGLP